MVDNNIREMCQWHPQTEVLIGDLREAVRSLLDGQIELKGAIIRLTENIKAVDKLERRVDKIEELQRLKEEKQEKDIELLKMFHMKVSAIVAVVAVLAPIIIPLLL